MDTQNLSTSNLFTDLGTVAYEECLELQKRLVRLRKKELAGNTILFLEHDPVYTIGRKADPENFNKVKAVRTERGGDVTYHGPGQLVAYFIFDTRVKGRRDVGYLLRTVEKAVTDSLHDQGFEVTIGEEPGFWMNGIKVGSLGMAMDDYVSYHGISLNYSMKAVDGFRKINPCGLPPEVMGYVPARMEKFRADLVRHLSDSYGEFSRVSYSVLIRLLKDQERIPTSHIFS